MREVKTGSSDCYVTSVLMGTDGQIVGSYRKRKATHQGAVWHPPLTISLSPNPHLVHANNTQHAEGDKVGIFNTSYGPVGVMICFDVENIDIFEETVSHKPHIILNPTWIPTPTSMKSCRDAVTLATWRNSMETMSHKFEQICIENSLNIVRCDTPFPGAAGTSQYIGPYCTVYSPTMSKTYFSVFVDKNPDILKKRFEQFSSLFTPAERPRTERRDRTGLRLIKHNESFISLSCLTITT